MLVISGETLSNFGQISPKFSTFRPNLTNVGLTTDGRLASVAMALDDLKTVISVPVCMAIENVELLHGCSPEHFRTRTVSYKIGIRQRNKGRKKQRKVKMVRSTEG